ncbi:MAG: NAD dependent epimerase/dehydratase family [Candidatus Peregrinibacteria bacterium Gr01-1014_25]|nr:MAG: NAD dependent epimerase/dehydratase family [Candidatus Peregrinibacteria bacterium Gr01-1014_25]
MRLVVTGSSGTIGTRLCETLLAQKHDVVGVDRRPNAWNAEIQKLTVVRDLRDPHALDDVPPDGVDAIVHLAAEARVHDLVIDPSRALDNMQTVFNALEWSRKHSIPFLFASSRECYGNIDADRYTEDRVRIENCESPYAASKLTGEALVHAYRRCYDLPSVILRFSNVYGAYDTSNRVIPLFFRQASRSEPLVIFGEEKCLDFTYIDDAVRGILLAVGKIRDVSGGTFNIACGQGTTLQKLAQVMCELLHSGSSMSVKPSRVGEVFHYVADITAARERLGYEPTVPFDEGIVRTVEWYKAHASVTTAA